MSVFVMITMMMIRVMNRAETTSTEAMPLEAQLLLGRACHQDRGKPPATPVALRRAGVRQTKPRTPTQAIKGTL